MSDESGQMPRQAMQEHMERVRKLEHEIGANATLLEALKKEMDRRAKECARHNSETALKAYEEVYARAAALSERVDERQRELMALTKPKVWYDLDDIGNGQRFADRHAGMMKYSFAIDRWFVWHDNKVWLNDRGESKGQVHRLAKETVEEMKKQAGTYAGAWGEKLAEHAQRSASEYARGSMVAAARSESSIITKPDVFDPDNHLLNCMNGIIDLTTGKLHEHDQNRMMTMLCDAGYERGAHHERLDAYLWDTFRARPEDEHGPARDEDQTEELRDAVQRLVGMTVLCAGPSAELGPFLYGPGGSGKGTFTDFMALTLGTYATKIKSDAMMEQKGEGRFDLWRHAYSRLVYSQEMGDKRKFNSERWKSWVSGDKQELEQKFCDQFEAKPKASIWLATNWLPQADARDTGMRRRLVIVPFNNIPKAVDRSLRAAIATDPELRAAFLWYVVEGARAFLERPLSIDNLPAEMRLANDEYWQQNNKVDEWLDQYEFSREEAVAKTNKGWFIATADLRHSYTEWMDATVDDRMLKALLEKRGAENDRQGKGCTRGYWGVRRRAHWGDGFLDVSAEAVAAAQAALRRRDEAIANGIEQEEDEPVLMDDE